MNNQRRKELENINIELNNLKEKLEKVLSDEEYAFDNMPENLQSSMRAENSEEAIDNMNEAVESLENAIDKIEDAAL